MKSLVCRPLALWLAALVLPGLAQAADQTFSSEASFLVASGATVFESFENLPARPRAAVPVATSLLLVNSGNVPIGVQTGPDAPEAGFGAAATDGTHYLSVYLPNQPQGTITFFLANPTTSFGFNILDVGEATGVISLRTGSGGFSGGAALAGYPPTLASGNVQFFGITQDQPFNVVELTVTGLDDAYGLDKIYVGGVVPEPGSALLFMGGAALLAWRRRRV